MVNWIRGLRSVCVAAVAKFRRVSPLLVLRASVETEFPSRADAIRLSGWFMH